MMTACNAAALRRIDELERSLKNAADATADVTAEVHRKHASAVMEAQGLADEKTRLHAAMESMRASLTVRYIAVNDVGVSTFVCA